MQYSNKKQLSLLKKIQLISGVVLLLAMALAIYLEHFMLLFVLGSLLILLLILVRIINFNYVRIQVENNRVILRYYPLYSTDRIYESIEFPIASLKKAEVRKYLIGLKWDLHLTVKLKQGLASYPPVCLSAIPLKKRKILVTAIQDLLAHPEI